MKGAFDEEQDDTKKQIAFTNIFVNTYIFSTYLFWQNMSIITLLSTLSYTYFMKGAFDEEQDDTKKQITVRKFCQQILSICQDILSRNFVNTFCQQSLPTHFLKTICQQIFQQIISSAFVIAFNVNNLSTYCVNTFCQHFLSIHFVNTSIFILF